MTAEGFILLKNSCEQKVIVNAGRIRIPPAPLKTVKNEIIIYINV